MSTVDLESVDEGDHDPDDPSLFSPPADALSVVVSLVRCKFLSEHSQLCSFIPAKIKEMDTELIST